MYDDIHYRSCFSRVAGKQSGRVFTVHHNGIYSCSKLHAVERCICTVYPSRTAVYHSRNSETAFLGRAGNDTPPASSGCDQQTSATQTGRSSFRFTELQLQLFGVYDAVLVVCRSRNRVKFTSRASYGYGPPPISLHCDGQNSSVARTDRCPSSSCAELQLRLFGAYAVLHVLFFHSRNWTKFTSRTGCRIPPTSSGCATQNGCPFSRSTEMQL